MPLKETEMWEGNVHIDIMMSNPGLSVVWDTSMTYTSDIWSAGIKMEEDGNMGRG